MAANKPLETTIPINFKMSNLAFSKNVTNLIITAFKIEQKIDKTKFK